MNRFVLHTSFPGDHRELEPPDPLPNSVVKWFIADGSVGFPHVRVGHRQDSKKVKTPVAKAAGVFYFLDSVIFSHYCRVHVKMPVPKVRLLDAKGAATRLRTVFAIHCWSSPGF
jgi:hypothetical protein